MNLFLAATRLPVSTLLGIGAILGLFILVWSYRNWRGAVKVALVVLLFEGAIRKWLFPGAQELVYFMKDGFLLGAYLSFFFNPGPERRFYKLTLPTELIWGIVAIVGLTALNPNIGHPLLSLVGLKAYFFYLPLLVMMPYLFRTREEMIREMTYYAMLAIPICLLGVAQYASGANSPLNVYAQQEGREGQGAVTFGLDTAIVRVRVTGTFSYITGHTVFVCFFSAIYLVLLTLEETRHKWVLLGVGLPLIAVNALMSGSRAALLTIGLLFVGFAVASFTGRLATSKHFKSLLVGGAIASVGVGIYFFQDAWTNWFSRYQGAGDTVYSRTVLHPLWSIEKAYEATPVLGVGMGSTQLITAALREAFNIPPPKVKGIFFDNEMGMVMNELGLMGFIGWNLLRLVLLVLVWTSYLRAPPGVFRALALAGFLLSGPFFFMSVVSNHSANLFLCSILGLGFIPYLESQASRIQNHSQAQPRGSKFPRTKDLS